MKFEVDIPEKDINEKVQSLKKSAKEWEVLYRKLLLDFNKLRRFQMSHEYSIEELRRTKKSVQEQKRRLDRKEKRLDEIKKKMQQEMARVERMYKDAIQEITNHHLFFENQYMDWGD